MKYEEEIGYSPVSVSWDHTIPLKKYPTTSRKAIEAYELKHSTWTAAWIVLQEKVANLNQAKLDDAELLRASIQRGEGDPGEIEVNQLNREITVQLEITKQAREAATAAADEVKASLKTDALELIPLVVENIDEAVKAYLLIVADFEPKYTEAVELVQSAYSNGGRMVHAELQKIYECNSLGTELGAIERARFRRDAIIQYQTRVKQAQEAIGVAEPRVRNLSAKEQSFN